MNYYRHQSFQGEIKGATMSNEELALYLTYEFSAHFRPNQLKEICLFNEVKIWSCADAGLPVFTYGKYHGRIADGFGLPALAMDEIHVRVSRNDVMDMMYASNHCESEIALYHSRVLVSVFNQICKQIEDYAGPFKNVEIEKMIHKKSNEIAALRLVVSKLERKDKVYAH